jgi:Domain of unknown function (DUF4263)
MLLRSRSRRPEPASDPIAEYLQLLDDGALEEKVQQFLEEHLSFWSGFMRDDTPCPLYAKVKLGSEHEIDFAFFDPSSDGPEWFLVEIERPGIGPMFLKNGDPSSKLMHAIHQVENWQDWIAANLPYAQQLMPQIDRPFGLVFFGRRSELQTTEARARLRALNHRNRDHLQVRTLDSFIDGARSGQTPHSIPPRALSHNDLRKGLPPDAKAFLEGLFGPLRHFVDTRYGSSYNPELEENTLEWEAGGEAIVRAAWRQQDEEAHQRQLRLADQDGRMELVYDNVVAHSDQCKPGLALGGTFSSFRLRLYEGYRKRPVAIATQLPFEGSSLTNSAKKLCEAVWTDFFPQYSEPPIWVEHYPDRDEWDFVEFDVTADRCLNSPPRWRPASQQQVETIVGQPVSPHRCDMSRPRCESEAFEETEE